MDPIENFLPPPPSSSSGDGDPKPTTYSIGDASKDGFDLEVFGSSQDPEYQKAIEEFKVQPQSVIQRYYSQAYCIGK
jgi:hypothetical protein